MSGLIENLEGVEGWLTTGEALLLYTAAREAIQRMRGTALVEIGSYQGRSTIALATACKELGMVLNAIDPHLGELGIDAPPSGPTWERFIYNLERTGLDGHVRPFRKCSFEVEHDELLSWDGQVGLVFIDGQHDEASARRDFEHFAPWFHRDVIVIFHDYGQVQASWGVDKVVNELLADGWRQHAHVGTAIEIRRKP